MSDAFVLQIARFDDYVSEIKRILPRSELITNIVNYPKAANLLLSNDHVITWTRTHAQLQGSLTILSRAEGFEVSVSYAKCYARL